MAGSDAIRIEGVVLEALPNSVFWVELPNGHRVIARLPRRLQPMALVAGGKVVLEMSPADMSAGRIVMEKK
ncbi:MAG: translation initiation factor IF-1 [Verrucomicrobiota bacterium]